MSLIEKIIRQLDGMAATHLEDWAVCQCCDALVWARNLRSCPACNGYRFSRDALEIAAKASRNQIESGFD